MKKLASVLTTFQLREWESEGKLSPTVELVFSTVESAAENRDGEPARNTDFEDLRFVADRRALKCLCDWLAATAETLESIDEVTIPTQLGETSTAPGR